MAEEYHAEYVDDTFETDELLLAAYLQLETELLYTEWEDKQNCFWIFPAGSDRLADMVDEYGRGEAVANLKSYNEKVAALKREMFQEQSRMAQPRRRRVRR